VHITAFKLMEAAVPSFWSHAVQYYHLLLHVARTLRMLPGRWSYLNHMCHNPYVDVLAAVA